MAKIKSLTNRDGEVFYPLTHTDAVIGNQGKSVTENLNDLESRTEILEEDQQLIRDTMAQNKRELKTDVAETKQRIEQVAVAVEEIEQTIIEGDVINAPDEEDLTTDEDNRLKFKDRPALNGMGYVILRKNFVGGKNLLTQDMINKSNTIYVIQYDFTLGENITVPENCVLEFDGGSISKGSADDCDTITGQNTCINSGLIKIFDVDVVLNGNWKLEALYPEWFGAKGNSLTDDSLAISKTIAAATSTAVNKVKFSSSQYYISDGINVEQGAIILEGVQCNLREDNSFSESVGLVRSSATSLIANSTSNSVITFGENVTHPIEIYNINFEGSQTNNAIDFKSEFNGPTWPSVIENCRFYGFDKAIFISADTPYNISCLQISSCAFHINNYCVYFDDNNNSTGTRSYITTNYTFEMFFDNNRAHHNTHIIRGTVTNGIISICNNNIEGGLEKYIDGTNSPYNHIILLMLGEGAKLLLKNNHCEVMKKNLLQLSIGERIASVDICKNDFTSDIGNIAKNRIDIVSNLSCILAKNLDVNSIYLTGAIKLCQTIGTKFAFPKLYPISNTANCTILSDFPIEMGNVIFPTDERLVCDYDNGIFVGKRLYGNRPSNTHSESYSIDKTKTYPFLIMYETCSVFDANLLFTITDDYEVSRYIYIYNGSLPNSKYVYIYYPIYGFTRDTIFVREIASNLYKRGVCFKLFTEEELSSNLFELIHGIERDNLISNNNTPITNMSVGNNAFFKNLAKSLWWNGIAWVDATGAEV